MATKPPLYWPKVANRHRAEAIMNLGEIIVECEAITKRLAILLDAVDDGNILLANAIANETRTRVRLISKIAASAQNTLETAPGPTSVDDADDPS